MSAQNLTASRENANGLEEDISELYQRNPVEVQFQRKSLFSPLLPLFSLLLGGLRFRLSLRFWGRWRCHRTPQGLFGREGVHG